MCQLRSVPPVRFRLEDNLNCFSRRCAPLGDYQLIHRLHLVTTGPFGDVRRAGWLAGNQATSLTFTTHG
jgi:hypothetical protein